MNFNKVLIAGNLTKDVELSYTPQGSAYAKFDIAINEVWKTKDGEKKEQVTFVSVTTWGKQAESSAQYLKKGNPALIEGKLRLDKWDDKKTGEKRSKLYVIAERVIFLGGKTAEQKTTEATPEPENEDDENIPF